MTPKDLCQSVEAKTFLPFVEEIFSYKFEDTPNYNKLRFYLTKALLDNEMMPNNIFDWNNNYQK